MLVLQVVASRRVLHHNVSNSRGIRASGDEARRVPSGDESITSPLHPTSQSPAQSAFLTRGSLTVRTFQWNSGQEDISQETLQVLGAPSGHRGSTDLVAFCMTESRASKAPHEIIANTPLADDWIHIAYGKHTGIAGGEKNAQMLSVFLRQPPGQNYVVDPPAPVKWQSGIGWTIAGALNDELMQGKARVQSHSSVWRDVLTAETMIHQISSTGKGGLSATIKFHPTEHSDEINLAMMCAHLDSEDRDDRRDGLTQMMAEAASRKTMEKVPDYLKEFPCKVWDSETDTCRVLKTSSAVERQQFDAVFLMGDLNWRIQYVKEGGSVAPFPEDLNHPVGGAQSLESMIVSQSGRAQMFNDDPLNPRGTGPEQIVKDGPHGYGFQCNDPINTLPTYRRNGERECVALAAQLRECGMLGSNPAQDFSIDADYYSKWTEQTKDWLTQANITANSDCDLSFLENLVLKCYGKKSKKDKKKDGPPPQLEWLLKKEKKQAVKQRFLQLGWLDRLCARTVDNKWLIDFTDSLPWDEHLGGDHAPVEVVARLTDAKDYCETQFSTVADEVDPSIPTLDAGYHGSSIREDSRRTLILPGSEVNLVCPDNYRLNVVPEGTADAGRQGVLSLTCNDRVLSTPDGKLRFTGDHQVIHSGSQSPSIARSLSCLRYCAPLEPPEHAERVDTPVHPGGPLHVEGSLTLIRCKGDFELSGPAQHYCRADGTYGEESKGLSCRRTCGLVPDIEHGRALADLHVAKRNPQGLQGQHARRTEILMEGDGFTVECEETFAPSSQSVDSSIKCLANGDFDRPVPICLKMCKNPAFPSGTELRVTRGDGNSYVFQETNPFHVVLDGHSLRYACTEKGAHLIGTTEAQCTNTGTYRVELRDGEVINEDSFAAPKCVHYCPLPPTPENSEMVPLDPEVVVPLDPDETVHAVVQETAVQYKCKEGCVQIGGTPAYGKLNTASIKCGATGVFDGAPPKCSCRVKFTIHGIDTGSDTAMTQKTNQFKVKLFPLRVAGNIESDMKSYDKVHYYKVKVAADPEKDTTFPVEMHLQEPLNTEFLHLELCESSVANWLGHTSRCSSVARSDNPEAWKFGTEECTLCVGNLAQKYLEQARQHGDGPMDLELPMSGAGLGMNFVKMSVSFELDE